jgi:HSP20 family protein
MTLLTRWSPAGNLAAVEIDRLNRMFGGVFGGEPLGGHFAPAVDIYENAQQDVVIKAELPGFPREAIKVTFENQTLSIEGERQVETDVPHDKYHRMERQYGAFRRSITLPASVDTGRAQASYQDGVLTITLPRREETKPRQIQING